MDVPLWQAALAFIAMLWLAWQKFTGKIRFKFKGNLYFWIAFFFSIALLFASIANLFN